MGFRYHLATIVAIFLALGLGAAFSIFFGGPAVNAKIVEKQTKDIETLTSQFRDKITSLSEQNARYSNVVSSVIRTIRLTNLKVAIIQTGDYPDTTSKVRETLDQAGANVSGIMVVSPSIARKLDGVKADVITQLRRSHPNLAADASAVWQTIAGFLARGAQDEDLKILRDGNLIQMPEGDFSKSVEYAVIVGGASDALEARADTVDVPLIKELKSLSIKVIYVEPETTDLSYISNLRNSEIATIDNADTDIGRLALALAFHGPPGDYGVKRTARGGAVPSVRTQP